MSIKILVVTNSASDRLLFQHTLSEYCILTAGDGAEALRVLEEHDGIDLLITDLSMPNMNGFHVLESIKEDVRFRKLRTIIITNHEELENEIKGLKLGAIDYIRKPLHMDSLKARIDVHNALLRAEQGFEQLHEKALTFDMIFEQAPIGISITYRRDPNRSDEEIVRINSMYEQIEYSCAIRPALSPYPGTNPVTSGQDSCHIRPRFLRHSATVPALSGQ